MRLRRQGLFQQSMRRKGVHENDLFDWEKASSEVSVTNSGATTNIAVIESKKPGYVRRLLFPLTPFLTSKAKVQPPLEGVIALAVLHQS